jgi:Na+/proline symporter
MGGLLIIYTVNGGARAVAYTQKIQMVIIFGAMFLAGYVVVKQLPEGIGFKDALDVGGKLGKLNIITTGNTANGFDLDDRYNIWSGVIGGFFLMLSYFGTDQSQVGRYLTAQNNTESRLGLLMNGLVKIPMQFFILLIGVLIFSFYQFNTAPLSFNTSLVADARGSAYKDSLSALQGKYDSVSLLKQDAVARFIAIEKSRKGDTANTVSGELKALNKKTDEYRIQFKALSSKVSSKDTNDTNYIFLAYVKEYLPVGLKGLLIAIIFLAAWGSIAAALNSLAASTVVDFHQRFHGAGIPLNEYRLSQWYTMGWGVFSIFVAQFANQLGASLIEAVNVLGSLFYGVILGIFLVAFYLKKVGGTATFIAAVAMETFVVCLFFNQRISFLSWLPDISFLWMNAIGAIGLVLLALLLQKVWPYKKESV